MFQATASRDSVVHRQQSGVVLETVLNSCSASCLLVLTELKAVNDELYGRITCMSIDELKTGCICCIEKVGFCCLVTMVYCDTISLNYVSLDPVIWMLGKLLTG